MLSVKIIGRTWVLGVRFLGHSEALLEGYPLLLAIVFLHCVYRARTKYVMYLEPLNS